MLTYTEGQNLLVDVGIDYGITSNTYQWYKESQKLVSQTNRQLTINALQLTDAGDYYCEIKNPNALGLTLNRRLVKVVVNKQPCPTLPKPIFAAKQLSICQGKSTTINTGAWKNYQWSTGAITATINVNQIGQYKITVSDDGVCYYVDSVQVTVGNQIKFVKKVALCEGANYDFNDTLRSKSGLYCKLFPNPSGCDSLYCIDLSVVPKIKETIVDVTRCKGQKYIFKGQEFTKTGNYPLKLISKDGCDSNIIINLKVIDENDFQLKDDEYIIPIETKKQTLDPLGNDTVLPDMTLDIIQQPDTGKISIVNKKFEYSNSKGFKTSTSFKYEVCSNLCKMVCSEAEVKLLSEDDFDPTNCVTQYGDKIINGITPNDNHLNEFFDPIKDLIVNNCPVNPDLAELHIINTWGDVIFRAKPYKIWHGTRKNEPNGPPVENGIYYYVLIVKTPDGKKEKIAKGKLLVILPK